MVTAAGPGLPAPASPDALLVVVWVCLGCGPLLLTQGIALVVRARRRQSSGIGRLGIAVLAAAAAILLLAWRAFATVQELRVRTVVDDGTYTKGVLWAAWQDQILAADHQYAMLMLASIIITVAALGAGAVARTIDRPTT